MLALEPKRARPPPQPVLVCPTGSLRALQVALDAGADAVYLGLKDATNARNFAGLDFDDAQLRTGIRYAHTRGRQVLMALNTFADAHDDSAWQRAVDHAAELAAAALIVADVAVMAYARRQHPELRLHLSVQASARTWEAIEFYRQRYGIRRAVLLRVLTQSQVQDTPALTKAEIEVFGFGFGSLCLIVEGRCARSAYVTGQSPDTAGVCSPPSAVRWEDTAGVEARLGGVLIDRYAADEPRGYPSLCKGPLQCRRPARLCDRGTHEPEYAFAAAAAHRSRRLGDQDRRPPARHQLRGRGHARVAQCHRRCRVGRAVFGAAGLEFDAGPSGRGPAADAGRLRPAGVVKREQAMNSAALPRRFGLTVGPLQYWWLRIQMLGLYAEVAEQPAVATVVLGEVTCSRRNETKAEDWLALARDLPGACQTVVLATMPLIGTEAELRTLRRLCEPDEFAVEAGDVSALAVLARQHEARPERPAFVIGPHVNVYSRAALAEWAPRGAGTWVPPLELSLDAVGHINPPGDPVPGDAGPVVTEVLGFSRMPLAFSARCFTARHHRLKKDECDFRCRDDGDGLLLATSEGEPFLVLNGIQTQSAAMQCLLDAGPALTAAGVRRLRLSPCSGGFAQALAAFDDLLNHGGPAVEALAPLRRAGLPGALVDGFARQRSGMVEVAA